MDKTNDLPKSLILDLVHILYFLPYAIFQVYLLYNFEITYSYILELGMMDNIKSEISSRISSSWYNSRGVPKFLRVTAKFFFDRITYNSNRFFWYCAYLFGALFLIASLFLTIAVSDNMHVFFKAITFRKSPLWKNIMDGVLLRKSFFIFLMSGISWVIMLPFFILRAGERLEIQILQSRDTFLYTEPLGLILGLLLSTSIYVYSIWILITWLLAAIFKETGSLPLVRNSECQRTSILKDTLLKEQRSLSLSEPISIKTGDFIIRVVEGSRLSIFDRLSSEEFVTEFNKYPVQNRIDLIVDEFYRQRIRNIEDAALYRCIGEFIKGVLFLLFSGSWLLLAFASLVVFATNIIDYRFETMNFSELNFWWKEYAEIIFCMAAVFGMNLIIKLFIRIFISSEDEKEPVLQTENCLTEVRRDIRQRMGVNIDSILFTETDRPQKGPLDAPVQNSSFKNKDQSFGRKSQILCLDDSIAFQEIINASTRLNNIHLAHNEALEKIRHSGTVQLEELKKEIIEEYKDLPNEDQMARRLRHAETSVGSNTKRKEDEEIARFGKTIKSELENISKLDLQKLKGNLDFSIIQPDT